MDVKLAALSTAKTEHGINSYKFPILRDINPKCVGGIFQQCGITLFQLIIHSIPD